MVSTRRSAEKDKETPQKAAAEQEEEQSSSSLAPEHESTAAASGKKRSKRTPKKKKPVDEIDDDDDDAVSVEATTPAKTAASAKKSTASSKKKKTREQKQKETLRAKNTGVGLKISIGNDDEPAAAKKGKKIVFDEDNMPPPVENDDKPDETADANQAAQNEEDDDDDDAIEEVQGQAAREELLDLMKSEEKESAKATKKKRKRKERKPKEQPKEQDSDVDDADLDDNFFSQLDSIRHTEAEEQRKLQKVAAKAAAKGKHTTFVFSQDDDNDNGAESGSPFKVGGNIEVVVLGNNATSSFAGAGASVATIGDISKEAMIYSRNLLTDGTDSDVVGFGEHRTTVGGSRNGKKRQRTSGETTPWKRSKKGATARRMGGKGRPALLFSRKKR